MLFEDISPTFEGLVPAGQCWAVLSPTTFAQLDHWCNPTSNTIPSPPLARPPTGTGPPFVLPDFPANPFTGIVPTTAGVMKATALPTGRRLAIGATAEIDTGTDTDTDAVCEGDVPPSYLPRILKKEDKPKEDKPKEDKPKEDKPTRAPTNRPIAPPVLTVYPPGLYRNTFQYTVPTFGVASADIQNTLLVTQIFLTNTALPATAIVIGSRPFDLTPFTTAQAARIIFVAKPTSVDWTTALSVPFEVTQAITENDFAIRMTLVPTGTPTTTASVAIINPSNLQVLNPDFCTA